MVVVVVVTTGLGVAAFTVTGGVLLTFVEVVEAGGSVSLSLSSAEKGERS
jgi:hypothetical protein